MNPRPRNEFRLLAATALALASLTAGCGGDDEEGPPPEAEPEATISEPQTTTVEEPTPADIEAAQVQLASGSANGVELDTRDPISSDLIVGGAAEDLAAQAGCELQTDLPDEGDTHIAPNAPEPEYGTTPPTSGSHSPTPQADGAYLGTPDDVNVVHSLEHGRVAIQYSPEIDEDDQLQLKGVFSEKAPGALLFPNPELASGSVAVTAWRRLLSCPDADSETLQAVRAFRDEFRGKGPEAVPLRTG